MSLRDRIAAFEKSSSQDKNKPAPAPKPQGGVRRTWAPRPPSPSSPSAATSDNKDNNEGAGDTGGERRNKAFSAADAKESITKAGSLKERMRMLQGKGGFGGDGGSPEEKKSPPPVVAKKPMKWAIPSEEKEGKEGEKAEVKPETKPDDAAEEKPNEEKENKSVDEVEEPKEKEPQPETEEKTEEDEERDRRAAIAARMARLGGARVGMAPAYYGGPKVKSPPVEEPPAPAEEAKGDEGVKSPSVAAEDDKEAEPTPAAKLPSPSATPSETAKDEPSYFPSVDAEAATPSETQTKGDTLSPPAQATSPKEPAQSPGKAHSPMPMPSAPKRAAPPKKKQRAKSPAPPAEEEQKGRMEEEAREQDLPKPAAAVEDVLAEEKKEAESEAEPKVEDEKAPEPSVEPKPDDEDIHEAKPEPTEVEDVPAPASGPQSAVEPEPEPSDETAAEEPVQESLPVTKDTGDVPAGEDKDEETARKARIAEKMAKMGAVYPFGMRSPPSAEVKREDEIHEPPATSSAEAEDDEEEDEKPVSPPPLPPTSTRPQKRASQSSTASIPTSAVRETAADAPAPPPRRQSSTTSVVSPVSVGGKRSSVLSHKSLPVPQAEEEDEREEEIPRSATPLAVVGEDEKREAAVLPEREDVLESIENEEREQEQEDEGMAGSVVSEEAKPIRLREEEERIVPPPITREVPSAPEPEPEGEEEQEEVAEVKPRRGWSRPMIPASRPAPHDDEQGQEDDQDEEGDVEEEPPAPPPRRGWSRPMIPATRPAVTDTPPPSAVDAPPSAFSRGFDSQNVEGTVEEELGEEEGGESDLEGREVPDVEVHHHDDEGEGQGEEKAEVLEDDEGDPIDPRELGHLSRGNSRRASRVGLAGASQAQAQGEVDLGKVGSVLGKEGEGEGEMEEERDEEAERRQTIAERMKKLGGIRLGGAPPVPVPGARKASAGAVEAASPRDDEGDQEREQEAKGGGEEEQKEEMTEEEEERARKERIARKIAGMGGMRIGMAPMGFPPKPSARKASGEQEPEQPKQREQEAEEEAPPPPPARPPVPHPVGRPSQAPPAPATDEEFSEVEAASVGGEEEIVDHRSESESGVVAVDEEEEEDAPAPPPPPRPAGRPPVPKTSLPKRGSVQSPTSPSSGAGEGERDREFVMVDEPQQKEEDKEEEAPPPPPPPRVPHPGKRTSVQQQQGTKGGEEFEVDFGKSDAPDLSLSTSWDQVPPPPAGSAAKQETQTPKPQQQKEMSGDELMGVWGRVGTQVLEAATMLYDRSKKSLVGDGTYAGFVNAVLREVPNARQGQGQGGGWGYVVYQQNGTRVERRVADIMPGDVIAFSRGAKLVGKHGLKSYTQVVGDEGSGEGGEEVCGVISEMEGGKKMKVKVWEACVSVGVRSVEGRSYRLEDLKSGVVRVYRVTD